MKNTPSSFPLKPYLLKHRFYPFREYLKEHFAHKVHKIPIDAGFTYPNRDGRVAVGGCTYCINESFSPNAKGPSLPIKEQIEKGKAFHKKRYGAEKFIAYFQSFTNTYAPDDRGAQHEPPVFLVMLMGPEFPGPAESPPGFHQGKIEYGEIVHVASRFIQWSE